MTKKASETTFTISAEKKANRAEIRIIGVIGWETSSEDFRKQVDALVADGVKDAHVYINSPGGSCFDANEIVNIISSFKGTVTGEGGALVASAGTFIALHCKDFTMPANGQFMLHKPSAMLDGNAEKIENELKGLKNIEILYYNVYKSVVSDITALDKHWNSGDWWMTANEAKEMGFVTSVKPRVKIDKETAALATACGCPTAMIAEEKDTNKNEILMNFIALALGLKADATEAEITAELKKLKAKADSADELEKTVKELRTAQVTAMVDAQVGKKITADKRQHFIDLGEKSGIDVLQSTFAAMADIVKPIDIISVPKSPDGKTEKAFKDLTEDERTELREKNRVEYCRLYKSEYGVEPKLS